MFTFLSNPDDSEKELNTDDGDDTDSFDSGLRVAECVEFGCIGFAYLFKNDSHE